MTSFAPGSDPAAAAPAGTPTAAPQSVPAPAAAPATPPVVFSHGGRQYTEADLAKKLDSADTFIEQLKAEGAENRKAIEEMKAALQKNIAAADVLASIKGAQAPAANPSAPAAAPASPAEIAQLVIQHQEAERAKAQEAANWASVATQLGAQYGATVDAKVAEVAKENGLTLEAAAHLARTAPKAFLRLFPEVKAPASPMPQAGRVNPQSHQAPVAKTPGYQQARSTRELVNIYQERLKAAGLA